MTISRISGILSGLQAVPVKLEERIIIKTTESEAARLLLNKLNIPYPGKALDTPTP